MSIALRGTGFGITAGGGGGGGGGGGAATNLVAAFAVTGGSNFDGLYAMALSDWGGAAGVWTKVVDDSDFPDLGTVLTSGLALRLDTVTGLIWMSWNTAKFYTIDPSDWSVTKKIDNGTTALAFFVTNWCVDSANSLIYYIKNVSPARTITSMEYDGSNKTDRLTSPGTHSNDRYYAINIDETNARLIALWQDIQGPNDGFIKTIDLSDYSEASPVTIAASTNESNGQIHSVNGGDGCVGSTSNSHEWIYSADLASHSVEGAADLTNGINQNPLCADDDASKVYMLDTADGGIWQLDFDGLNPVMQTYPESSGTPLGNPSAAIPY